jgi:hypothetical protein
MSEPQDPTSYAIASVEVYIKVTPNLDEFASSLEREGASGEITGSASNGVASLDEANAASSSMNPFLVPGPPPLAAQATSASKSRQNHVFMDQDGNEKKFGSALGLLTAKFVDMILLSARS